MKGSEFLRLLKRLARKRGWDYEWIPDRGKGSHGTLQMNGRLTAHFSDRGHLLQADRGRRFSAIVDAQGMRASEG